MEVSNIDKVLASAQASLSYTKASLLVVQEDIENVYLPKKLDEVSNPEEDKRIFSEYDKCTILFYECTFSILRVCFTFNNFKIEVLNHMMIAPSQLDHVS